MNNLKQIQEESRKIIILANNPEAKNYKEALEMELGFGCEIREHLDTMTIISIKELSQYTLNDKYQGTSYLAQLVDEEMAVYPITIECTCKNIDCQPLEYENHEIIGKPLTLSKVLIALENVACDLTLSYDNLAGDHIANIRLDNPFNCEGGFNWDLTKEILEEQTEEVQREIYKLLTGAKNDKRPE